MHDIPGLVELMGKQRFVDTLDRHFTEGHNKHDNEPSHHYPCESSFLPFMNVTAIFMLTAWVDIYAMVPGLAWKTQERVREIAEDNYHAEPDGLRWVSGRRLSIPNAAYGGDILLAEMTTVAKCPR
jgi:putative alpha-1,2-mannosidase